MLNALQRVFHHEGEHAVAAAAHKYGTMFGVSSLGTASLQQIRQQYPGPQCYQFYFHKDRGLNRAMLENAKAAGIDVLMLTVDTITGGNRERDLRTGFSIPFRLNLTGLVNFAIKPRWAFNYLMHEKFSLPQLDDYVDMSGGAVSVGRYFTEMLDPTMTWDDVTEMIELWDGEFCLKGVMSQEDAIKAKEVGATGIVISNHGGRQLEGSRSPFDQLQEIVDAVGDDIDVIMDSGVQRGSHVLKALAAGADAIMMGSIFAGTEESPGKKFKEKDKFYKQYRGMGSIGAMSSGSANRYFQKNFKDKSKFVPEGVEGRVEYKGNVSKIIYQLKGGLRSSMGYIGAKDLGQITKNAKFIKITKAGFYESMVHSVEMIEPTLNYKL